MRFAVCYHLFTLPRFNFVTKGNIPFPILLIFLSPQKFIVISVPSFIKSTVQGTRHLSICPILKKKKKPQNTSTFTNRTCGSFRVLCLSTNTPCATWSSLPVVQPHCAILVSAVAVSVFFCVHVQRQRRAVTENVEPPHRDQFIKQCLPTAQYTVLFLVYFVCFSLSLSLFSPFSLSTLSSTPLHRLSSAAAALHTLSASRLPVRLPVVPFCHRHRRRPGIMQ